ncbi:YbgA family protein [Spirillospora sp. CA-294931]|uniref:YbgA family protein n=1 Tax=Spirillospora sp. CA-294931 TaxID=3240042 RepID=UPI003D8DD6C3
MTRPRVAVSSCLLGEPVRYNGGHSRDRFLTDTLDRHVDWVRVCPEMEAGLGAPRETVRLESAQDGPRLRTSKTGVDLTDRMTALATERAADLAVDGYVFKAKSPTCGIHGVPVHAGEGRPPERRNRGMFAGIVIDAHPLLPVEDEGRLRDAVLREEFAERIFAGARLRNLLDGEWRPRDLVEFHTRHKLQLLAHDPSVYRGVGRIVARAGATPRAELAAAYAAAFRTCLTRKATVGKNVNVLHHCVGMAPMDDVPRRHVLDVIAAYRSGLVPLSVPVTLVRHHALDEKAQDWLRDQSYFTPYPDDLRLRNHVPIRPRGG